MNWIIIKAFANSQNCMPLQQASMLDKCGYSLCKHVHFEITCAFYELKYEQRMKGVTLSSTHGVWKKFKDI